MGLPGGSLDCDLVIIIFHLLAGVFSSFLLFFLFFFFFSFLFPLSSFFSFFSFFFFNSTGEFFQTNAKNSSPLTRQPPAQEKASSKVLLSGPSAHTRLTTARLHFLCVWFRRFQARLDYRSRCRPRATASAKSRPAVPDSCPGIHTVTYSGSAAVAGLRR